ncbi:MAG TPA: LysE family transporter [Ktedonobacteraceae bacterium]|jgi:threonine/homoserine/homoserine lactone efflux protein
MTMDAGFFVRGFVSGFSIAAVVGPIGILCIQRTLHRGFLYGLLTGLGAATADGIYGGIAVSGLTIIWTLLFHQQNWIRLSGGLLLAYLGIKVWLTRPVEQATRTGESSFPAAYASTLLLTLTNPLTILSFATALAGLGAGTISQSGLSAILVTAGVFCGSCTWWLLLSAGVSLLRGRITARWPVRINRLAGSALMLFAIITVFRLIL